MYLLDHKRVALRVDTARVSPCAAPRAGEAPQRLRHVGSGWDDADIIRERHCALTVEGLRYSRQRDEEERGQRHPERPVECRHARSPVATVPQRPSARNACQRPVPNTGALSKILGHANIKMTQRYAKLAKNHIARTGNTARKMWRLMEGEAGSKAELGS